MAEFDPCFWINTYFLTVAILAILALVLILNLLLLSGLYNHEL